MKLLSLSKASGIALLAACFFSGPAFGAVGVIANSKHDLSSGSTGGNQYAGTDQICVFCHTPHGADSSAAVPLWNRTLSAPGSYTTYDTLGTTSLDGDVLAVGSVSIACLSCHDGVSALNAVINEPGSGMLGIAAYEGQTWTSTSGNVDTGTYKMTGAAVTLGVDLTNDHPVGVQYGGGGNFAADNFVNADMNDKDFKDATYVAIGTNDVWYVEASGNAIRDKEDMLLYTRTNGAADEAFVECASCHDPHNGVGGNGMFLRKANTGSALCLACHIK